MIQRGLLISSCVAILWASPSSADSANHSDAGTSVPAKIELLGFGDPETGLSSDALQAGGTLSIKTGTRSGYVVGGARKTPRPKTKLVEGELAVQKVLENGQPAGPTRAIVARPPAATDCSSDVAALRMWATPYRELTGRGAFGGPTGSRLWLPELGAKPSKPPAHPAALLEVTESGFKVDGKSVPAAGLQQALLDGANLSFAATHPNAIFRGVLVAASAKASAPRVKTAIEAALATRENVFVLSAPSAAAFGAAPDGSTAPMTFDEVVEAIGQEAGRCPDAQRVLRRVSDFGSGQSSALLVEIPDALAKCQCNSTPEVWKKLLWRLAVTDLVFSNEVRPALMKSSAWGKGPWGETAKALFQ